MLLKKQLPELSVLMTHLTTTEFMSVLGESMYTCIHRDGFNALDEETQVEFEEIPAEVTISILSQAFIVYNDISHSVFEWLSKIPDPTVIESFGENLYWSTSRVNQYNDTIGKRTFIPEVRFYTESLVPVLNVIDTLDIGAPLPEVLLTDKVLETKDQLYYGGAILAYSPETKENLLFAFIDEMATESFAVGMPARMFHTESLDMYYVQFSLGADGADGFYDYTITPLDMAFSEILPTFRQTGLLFKGLCGNLERNPNFQEPHPAETGVTETTAPV